MNSNTHFFFALTLPDETKEYIYEITEQIRTEFPFKKWLHKEDYHITLAFLGNAPDDLKKKSIQLVEEALSEEGSFPLTLFQIGTFGSKDFPKILWSGTAVQERLFEIQRNVYNACLEAGFSLDKKLFKPHITIARKYIGERPFSIEELQEKAGLASRGHSFTASAVTLYQTHIGSSPSYEAIFTTPLK
ncbi:RNA 2',3'-cyclic phosphodiesterase [Peribacillus cavernae]|uniref:RNA 2',3'-cyclic phosphodiesterase n=1 Tax=Peribacillus cavernae TaxID=1674310 RepID=A0A433HUE5_9BACI|nr:RNA 2',3'-cyclic phosphodiesterase [Peribacillus cavernae]MDQ0220305.1 2'-5' RNA ligase [Peribacillus cavernae]RUQ31963.1 RNA 2',3'-cyclic phosphodiesterase [Peribacillus cavernae]